jgi:hypothetical protein
VAAEALGVADDAHYTASGWSLRNGDRQRPYLSLTTLVLDYRPLPELRLSIGRQIVNWDVFDGLQPANLFATLDQSDPFRTHTRGVDGVSLHYEIGPAFADLTVVPLAFTPTRSPQDRWIIVPSAVPYDVSLPPVRVEETQAGLRIGGRAGALEASAFGYVGRDHLPLFVLDFVRLNVVAVSPRLHVGGLNASYAVGERLLLRMEEVYFSSPDENRGNYLTSVVGGEYVLGDWRAVAGYLRQDLTERAPEKVLHQGERTFFQSFVSGELRWDPQTAWRARVRGGYDTRGEFALVEPEVAWRVWRSLEVALTGNWIVARRDNTYFAHIRHEDRVALRMRYDF